MGCVIGIFWDSDEHCVKIPGVVLLFLLFLIVPFYFYHHTYESDGDYRKSKSKGVKSKMKKFQRKVEALWKCAREEKSHCPETEHFQISDNRYVNQLVHEKLEIYELDKTGLPDFALETLGGCVVSTRKTKSVLSGQFTLFGIPITSQASDPRAVIQPTVQPGTCWAFYGDKGEIVIKLVAKLFVSHVTLEHISPKISPSGDILSAPKTFSVWGLSNLHDTGAHYYGLFDYRKDGPTVQMFKVHNPSPVPHRLIEVKFISNQGDPRFTCVYRLRVHGRAAK